MVRMGSMRLGDGSLLRLAVLTAVLMAGGRVADGQVASDAERAALERDLTAWFECEECDAGESDKVLQWKDKAVPGLIAALEHGPSIEKRDALRGYLEKHWKQLADYGNRHPESKISLSQTDFVNLYLANFEAMYQARAALALGVLRTPLALQALRKALQSKARDDVKARVLEALKP